MLISLRRFFQFKINKDKKFSTQEKLAYSKLSLIKHGKNIFYICRSLTGQGVRDTLDYFEKYHPEFKRIKFKSGEKVFDWEIPLEWNIRDAYVKHIKTDKKYCDFSNSNLHIVSYSEPVDKIMDLEELSKKLYTQPDQPNLIPYVTSYYFKDWGFCLSQNEKKNLPEGNYHVKIDSTLKKGNLDLSHAQLKGRSSKEILFTSYICHPSLANNELSGPLVLNGLIDFIKSKNKKTKYSYRFLLVPETIGSIAYLSKFHRELKSKLICGYNLSCVGDERGYSHIKSPYGNNLADIALSAALKGYENVNTYSYLERGSDERQFCAPNIDLPICTFCKTKFGEYPEYHTSGDDFSVVTEKGLKESLEVMKQIIEAFELSLYPKVAFKCEPQLGKRGLYPNISQKSKYRHPAQSRMDIIAFCNGKNNIFQISHMSKLPLKIVIEELRVLIDNGLVIDNCKSYNWFRRK